MPTSDEAEATAQGAFEHNEHYGTLLADYLVLGKGQSGDYGWSQGYTGPITIRLTS